jgi:hypothetical protein
MNYLRQNLQCCSFDYVLDGDEIMKYDHDGHYEGQLGELQIPHGLGRSVKNDGAYSVKQCNSLNLDLIASLNCVSPTLLRQVPYMKVFGSMAVTMELGAFQIRTQVWCTEVASKMGNKKETACLCIGMERTIILTLRSKLMTRARKTAIV